METHHVTFFQPYPFKEGQKINIKEGPRSGDWEVIGVTDRRVKLKCPVSHKEFEWNRFCYVIEDKENVEWPKI